MVIKRNGTVVTFNKEKIKNAVNKAFMEIYGKENEVFSESIAQNIAAIEKEKDLQVEEIQDLVENQLIKMGCVKVAKAYIKYRYKRQLARDDYAVLMNAVKEKITGSNVENKNANLDEASFGGRIGETADLVMKEYALKYCMSETSKNNHLNNEIYIHDLNSFAIGMHNCLTIPFDDLLANGFNTRQTDVRPAGSINTAMQLVAVIFQLQSLCQFGGVSASHLDWTMVPYIRKSFAKHYKDGLKYISNITEIDYEIENMLKNAKDWSIEDSEYEAYDFKAYKYAIDMTEKELAQAVQGLFHNLNTLQSRSGCQLPFTSVNIGSCTLPEGRMFTKAMLEGCLEGVGKFHKTAIFPCLIFQCGKGINLKPEDPNYDLFQLALKSTAKRLYPNYANLDWSGNAGYDQTNPQTYFSTMGKRKLQLM